MIDIIKNKIYLYGSFDDVQNLKKEIRSDKSQIDFNKIEPMEKDVDDLPLDDYINLCLNIYIKNNKQIREKLISTFEFVGITRMYPYKFVELTMEDISKIKQKYSIREMQKDTKTFIEKIKSKSIFNGYMVRDALWGTGSGAFDVKVKDNSLEFTTFSKAPLKLFLKISKMYPKIIIDYTYQIDKRITKLKIADGSITKILDENENYIEPVLFNLISKEVLI